MELIVYLACVVLVAPYLLMAIASFKIHKELKEAINSTNDNLDLPTTL
jgi:hypothetical protein